MKKLRSVRPTPALVIAMIALFAAVGGGVAWALPGKNTVNSGDVQKNSLKGKDINESTLKIPQGSVVTPGGTSGVVPNGFALVFGNGNNPVKQGSVISVKRVGVGIYCFDLSAKPNGAVAMLESSDSGNDSVSGSTATNNCAAPTNDYQVNTNRNAAPFGGEDSGFNIAFF
jgi:hypothetical protein